MKESVVGRRALLRSAAFAGATSLPRRTSTRHAQWLTGTLLTAGLIALHGAFAPVLLAWLTNAQPLDDQLRTATTELRAHVGALGTTMQVQFFIVDRQTPSALSVGVGPTSTVFVSRGLMAMDAPTVRFALAHELAHLQAGHPILLSAFFAALYATKTLMELPPIAILLALLGYLAVLRQAELQADRGAARWLGTSAAKQALHALAAALGETRPPARWITLLSTHPSFAQRCSALNMERKKNP